MRKEEIEKDKREEKERKEKERNRNEGIMRRGKEIKEESKRGN